jgi:Xaa-Pro aminopeptidase
MTSGSPERLAHLLEERDCRALLVVSGSGNDPDMAPFVGPVHLGRSFLVLAPSDSVQLGYLAAMERDEAAATGLPLIHPADLDVDALAREHDEPAPFWAALLERALAHAGVPAGRVALAGHLGAGRAAGFAPALEAAGWPLTDGHEVVRLLRKTKRDHELAAIRAAAAGTVAAFRRVAEMLAAAERGNRSLLLLNSEPLTVGRVRAEVFRVLSGHGLEQPEGNLIAPAEEGAVPHSAGTDERVLRAGESLVVDLFPRGRLFADCTRTFCVGEPPELLAKAHALVLESLERSRRAAKPGVTGWELQQATCELFQEHGYATPVSEPGTEEGYVHNLGHGVGYELHEYPSFRRDPGPEGVLEALDVVTLEPGLYSPRDRYGVRLEDLVILGEDGIAEDLTPLPYELDPRSW